jgi:hypothetical protein
MLPLLLAVTGIVALIYGLTAAPRSAEQLTLVEGVVESVAYTGKSGSDLAVRVVGRRERFDTDALGNTAAIPKGSTIRLYSLLDSPFDRVQTFGLWVDGREIESLEAALQKEASVRRWIVPLSIGLLGLAFFLYRANQAAV